MTSMVLEHPGVLVGGEKGAVHWGVPVPGHQRGLGPSWAREAGKEAALGLWPPWSMPALQVTEVWPRGFPPCAPTPMASRPLWPFLEPPS